MLHIIAILKGYNFNRETGKDNLLVVSIGTGFWHDHGGVDAIIGYKVSGIGVKRSHQ